uniref:Vinculin n=1 Tax=Aceria tosichella TaxID=561515 RepID=A0A6G1S7H0_9ACAR
MPVFHTKTIESILEPVAFQVSRLVILHEEAEDGNAMPDLSKPVEAVSWAVENLTKVGKETINKSDDQILRADMPNSLQRVDRAARLLEEAAYMLKSDPYSQQARQLLIEGSRGILQGTSSLLLCFDESEVRKLIKSCQKVLAYMQVVEVIERMEDLVTFVKDLTPALTKVSRDVNLRQRELTHQAHRELLLRCLENLKQEAPGLISSMKTYIQLLNSKSSTQHAAENRNYHTGRMVHELNEIIRVLQLTTYDDDEWDSDSLTYMKRALGAMTSKVQSAHDWLEDPFAPNGGIGEKSLRQILEHAERIADRSLPEDRDAIKKQCSDIRAMVEALCELRQAKQASSPQAHSLAKNIGRQLRELLNLCTRAIANMELGGNLQPAHTLSGRMDQAQRWLNNLHFDDHGLGEQAVQAIINEARKLALACPLPQLRQQILDLCNEAERLNRQLGELCRRSGPQAAHSSHQAQAMARELGSKLREIQRFVQAALVNRVVDDFIDATLSLRQFTEIVLTSSTTTTTTRQQRNDQLDEHFKERARNLSEWSRRATQTAQHVATNSAQNKRLAETINSVSGQMDSQTPQLISAGQIRYQHADSSSAHENFMHMRDQYESTIIRLRNLIDEAIDSAAFVRASEEAIRRHTQLCEMAISTRHVQGMVDNAASIARLANRVIMVARQESNNSEDSVFIKRVDVATRRLQELVPQMVRHAKDVATSISDIRAHNPWRQTNQQLLEAVVQIGQALGPSDIGDLSRMYNETQSSTTKRTTTTTTTTLYDQQQQQARGGGAYGGQNHMDPQQQQPVYGQTPSPRSSGYKTESSPRHSAVSPNANQTSYSTSQHHTTTSRHHDNTSSAITDDEEERFPTLQPNQPIMMAAHDLHQEVKQWSSKENEIIAAAKKLAFLMVRLSALVRGDKGTKKDLISCAQAIAEASQEVTRLAKEQAKLCTDRKMRTNILQVCERIPTMGTQLRILSTVKATMLGVQGSQEDQEAMDMIVGNAQNLMSSIKDTVKSCEAASIKIRTDQGVKVRWIRKEPWYT